MPPDRPRLPPLLTQRRSTPARLLGEPGPSQVQIEAMLGAAVAVPDHGRLTPWRFIRIAGTARAALGEILVARQRERSPEADDQALDKDRRRFAHAPLVIAVIGRIAGGHRIPEQEQLLSGGAVCLALLQAAYSLGFGAQLLTGWPAYDPAIARRLGLEAGERVLGFVHIGTAQGPAPESPRPDPLSLLRDWTP